jgi:cephalosporin-C deacetylase-like acetyl esterase
MPRPRLLASVVTVFVLSFVASGYAEQLMLEVEEFQGPWRRQTNIAGYRGTGFCTSNANPAVADSVMQTTAELTTAGRYAVWLRGYTSENSRRAMRLEVAGQLLEVTHRGSRRQWNWEKAGEVQLAAGPVAIAVHDADVGFETADAVLLTDDPNEDPGADQRQWFLYGDTIPDRASALRFNIDACVALARARTDPQSQKQWQARRPVVQQALEHALGFDPQPDKTPLNARITGRAERDTYTIENVLFESLPQFYVTANVYVPKHAPRPLPAIVVTAGHAMPQGKNYDLYRTAQLGLVRQGYLVLAYDPIGQGERQLPGYSHQVSYAALLTGKSNLHYMVWDSIRAVDYLVTREDVDPARIGLTGNSGGGLNTMYTMPVEPRLAAGASFCCLCSYEHWIADGGNHCICNHLPAVCGQFEQFEFVGLCAPRPFLSGNGADDPIFPIEGVRKTIQRAAGIYAFEGAGQRVQLQEAPLPHGWSGPLREAAYGWFDRWLQDRGDGGPIAEQPIELEDWQAEDLQVLKDDQLPADARSYVDLVRAEAERLIGSYPAVPAEPAARDRWADELRCQLWQLLGGRPADWKPHAVSAGTFVWQGHSVERLRIDTEQNLEVPALLIRPAGASGPIPVVIAVDDDGKQAVRHRAVLPLLLSKNIAVLALDVRGTGEVQVPENHCASDAIVLGRPLLAQQAWDLACAARYLASREDIDAERISLYGRGSLGTVVTLAGALFDPPTAVVAQDSLGSFLDAVGDPLPQPLAVYAPRILQAADVPQLVALCSQGRFLWINPIGAGRAGISEEAANRLQQRIGPGANAVLQIAPSPDQAIADFLSGL